LHVKNVKNGEMIDRGTTRYPIYTSSLIPHLRFKISGLPVGLQTNVSQFAWNEWLARMYSIGVQLPSI